MIRVSRRKLESWTVIRARMLHETEVFLEAALRSPDRQVVIPAIPVGRGQFRRGFADLFWAQVLGTS
jgi:hypothetical protein